MLIYTVAFAIAISIAILMAKICHISPIKIHIENVTHFSF